MKFILHFRCCYFCILVLTAINTVAQNVPPCLNATVDFKNEEFSLEVNGKPYEISSKTIKKNKKRFNKKIKCSGENCDTTKLPIKAYDIVNDLYSVSRTYLNDDNSGCKGKKCISGVWIILGMKSNQPTYFFEPVVLKDSGTNKDGHVFNSIMPQGKIYEYINGKFDSVSQGSLKEQQNKYYDKIRIKHNRFALWAKKGSFSDNSWKGDSRRLFYSFQEILGFYSRQNPNENPFYCGNIYINPSVGFFRKNRSTFWRVKHNTFITVDRKEEGKKGRKENNNIAISESVNGTDLAHVCPSNCDNLTYPAATTNKELVKTSKR